MTFLHLNSGARLQGSNTRILGQYLVNALELGVPMYNFGIPEPLRQWIDASGSKGTPEHVISHGKQKIASSVSSAELDSHSTVIPGAA